MNFWIAFQVICNIFVNVRSIEIPLHLMKSSKLFLITALLGLAAATSVHAQVMFTIGDIGTAGGVNNWPGAESPDKVNDGITGTKYLNFGKLDTGYIFTPVTTGTVVTGITFATANDAVPRDPASFILFGSNSQIASVVAGTVFNVSGDFTQISAGALALPVERLTAGGNVSFTNTTAYDTYLLVFPTVKDAVAANSMQIAEASLQTVTGGGVGQGVVGGGQLSTVPETGSSVLAGLVGMGLLVRRRRN